MKKELWSSNISSVLYFCEGFLKHNVYGDVLVQSEPTDKSVTEKDIIKKAISKVGQDIVRCGFLVHRRNKDLFTDVDSSVVMEFVLLDEFVCEGHCDSVEFRRLVRKYVRRAKQLGWKKIYLFDLALVNRKARKIIQQMLGSQIELVTLVDVLEKEDFHIHVVTSEDKSFVASVMKENLGDNNIKIIDSGEVE